MGGNLKWGKLTHARVSQALMPAAAPTAPELRHQKLAWHSCCFACCFGFSNVPLPDFFASFWQ